MTQLIIGFLLTILGGVVGVFDKWKSKNETGHRKSNSISTILLVVSLGGGLISFLAGIDAIHSSTKNDKIAQERQQKIESQGSLIYKSELANQNLLDKNLQYSIRLDSSTKLNYLLSNKITNQANQLNDYLTGKGSFCYFDVGFRDPNTNNYHYSLYSSGNNPMDNVVARIVDVFDIRNGNYGTILHVGKVFPKIHTVRFFATTYTPIRKDSIWLNIFFQTNGREFVEELKELYSKEKWSVYMNVSEEGKTLLNRIDTTFPRNWVQ